LKKNEKNFKKCRKWLNIVQREKIIGVWLKQGRAKGLKNGDSGFIQNGACYMDLKLKR